MILGTYTTLPNPVQVQAAPFSLVAGNVAMGGVKMQRLIRYWILTGARRTRRALRLRTTPFRVPRAID